MIDHPKLRHQARLVAAAALLCAIVAMPDAARAQPPAGQPAPISGGPVGQALIDDLVIANHILVDQGVLDGFGHVSVRHPKDSNRYLMARNIAPELVTAADILESHL